jgi:hypothetical protein
LPKAAAESYKERTLLIAHSWRNAQVQNTELARPRQSNRRIFELEETAMKKNALVLTIVLLFGSVSMFGQAQQSPPSSQGPAATAQPPHDVTEKDIEMLRQDLRDQRKQIVALNMPLTADEATKFWPVFDQYRNDAIKLNDVRWQVIKDYAAQYNTMTDAQAQDLMKRENAVDQQLLALRMRYVPTFEKVISAKKTALFYQIDRRVDLLINLQLSSMIPMVNPTK